MNEHESNKIGGALEQIQQAESEIERIARENALVKEALAPVLVHLGMTREKLQLLIKKTAKAKEPIDALSVFGLNKEEIPSAPSEKMREMAEMLATPKGGHRKKLIPLYPTNEELFILENLLKPRTLTTHLNITRHALAMAHMVSAQSNKLSLGEFQERSGYRYSVPVVSTLDINQLRNSRWSLELEGDDLSFAAREDKHKDEQADNQELDDRIRSDWGKNGYSKTGNPYMILDPYVWRFFDYLHRACLEGQKRFSRDEYCGLIPNIIPKTELLVKKFNELFPEWDIVDKLFYLTIRAKKN